MSDAPPPSRAPRGRRGVSASVRAWFAWHLQSLVSSLGDLARRPLATVLTVGVIAVALALPAAGYVALLNAKWAARGWDGQPRVSLFLHADVDEAAASALARSLQGEPGVATVRVIGRAAALAEYRSMSGLGEVADVIGEGAVLPVVVEVMLRDGVPEAQADAIATALGQLREVEFAQFDLQWVRRLAALMRLLERLGLVLGGLVGLGVVVVVGSTIGLRVEARREEIAIARLFGGTNGFVRRPFLYAGLVYGLAGGALALAVVHGAMIALDGPVAQVAGLYDSGFRLVGPGLDGAAILVGGGGVLGLLGAFLGVRRQLRVVE